MATRYDPDGTDGPLDPTGADGSGGGGSSAADTTLTSPNWADPSWADTNATDTSATDDTIPRTTAGTIGAAAVGGAGGAGAVTPSAVTERFVVPARTTVPDTTRDDEHDERLRAEATERRRVSAYELARAKSRNTRMTDVGLLLLRVLPIIMFLHGLFKAQNYSGFRDGVAQNSFGALAPDLFAIMIVAGQLVLPILIALGLFTRIAALLMAIMMVMVWVLISLPQGMIDPANGGIRSESALLYAFLALPLVFTGPGRFSLDHALFGKRADARAHRKADKAVA